MGIFTRAKAATNAVLQFGNMRVDSLTAERVEAKRLKELEQRRHFDEPIFPILPQFRSCDPSPVFGRVRADQLQFTELTNKQNGSAFRLQNDYYTTPDAEVLYAMVKLYRPRRIVEVGSGNSTHLFRLAAQDLELGTHITSIDPHPRRDIGKYSDDVIRDRVETIQDMAPFQQLGPNDILFIDSSHEIKPGNDLLYLVFNILPRLSLGVLIHFHDIFLPYEYPREWLIQNRWNWTEQYLVQALLTENQTLDVVWPGYYLQRTWPAFEKEFRHWRDSTARSLWLRKR